MKKQESAGGKEREMRILFSEMQAFGEEIKNHCCGFCCYHSGLYKQLAGWKLSKLPRCSPDRVFTGVWDMGARPGCRQLPALQHPWPPPATSSWARAGWEEEVAQSMKHGRGHRAGKNWVEDVFPPLDVSKDPSTLAWHRGAL